VTAGRRLYLGLQLLDRQLVDRRGRLVGKVDDVELEPGETGELYVRAILSGPGVLADRLRLPWGAWVRRVHRLVSPPAGREERDPARIPFSLVSEIGNHVTLAAEQEDLATWSTDRWVADHVIERIPGGRRAPE
jgi:sporulation protein YlmC with PRC-barrel domain